MKRVSMPGTLRKWELITENTENTMIGKDLGIAGAARL